MIWRSGFPKCAPSPRDFFSQNVDAWGALEWFDRLAKAVRQQDAAVRAGNDLEMEMCRNVAASSAMRLVRDYEQEVRAALLVSRPDRETPKGYWTNGGKTWEGQ